MRVINQSGTVDIPYEDSLLIIGYGNYKHIERAVVKCYNPALSNCAELAEYTSNEKALKAMELLRSQYRTFTDESRVKGLYAVFQFPQDSEVEV